MNSLKETIIGISEQHNQLKKDLSLAERQKMPGNAYFIYDNNILTIPSDEGDCRYPYGRGGFNFWAYASGYMHCNEGLFSPFLRAAEGQEPKIAFFAGFSQDEKDYRLIPLLSVPVLGIKETCPIERYTVFAKSCVYYITETSDIRFTLRVFPDKYKNIYFTINLENLSKRPRKLFISSFINPFLCHDIAENGESRWFREVRYSKGKTNNELGHFIIKANEDLNRTASVANIGVIHRTIKMSNYCRLLQHEETASRYQYVGGNRSSLHSPEALKKGSFGIAKHVCAFTEMGAAGDIIHLELGGSEEIRYDISFGYKVHCKNDNEAKELLEGKFEAFEIDRKLAEIEIDEENSNKDLKLNLKKISDLSIKEEVFNPFFEHLKKQVEFCSLIKGYVQLSKNSLIGIRDIFQAIEAYLFWQPKAARSKMLEALEFIDPSGRCPRQYTLPTGEGAIPVMDLRAFIDQGVWVISTIITYLKFTGDLEFLKEECGYYEIIDEKKAVVKKSQMIDSVLEHLFKVMDYLLANRDLEQTGCIKVLYGDWNDALDGLGVSSDPEKEYGNGVSVMATLQVYENLTAMIELLKYIDSMAHSKKISYYETAAKELEESLNKFAVIQDKNGEKRIVHGWGDKRSYFVGSFDDSDHKSRYGLTSSAYWVLSGLYNKDKSIGSTILNTFDNLDSKYGYKTFEPHFEPNTPGVGRIPKLPKGTAENGAVYIHAAAFAVMALFRMGEPEKAWRQLSKLLPFTHDKVSCSPYVMPNSYGFNEDKIIDGESMVDWQTGSSNVILKIFIKYVAGINPEYDGIWIQPAGWANFEGFSFDIKIRSSRVRIIYTDNHTGIRRFKVNGQYREGIHDEEMKLTKLWISEKEFETTAMEIIIED